MESTIIYNFSWPSIVKLIYGSKSQIRLILPSIHMEWADLLEIAKTNGVNDIKVCLNNSEKSIRDGFGDDKAIQKLIDLKILLNETPQNRISLISVDSYNYLYFPTSRIFESNIDENFINAIEIDQFTAASILSSFFPEDLAILRESLLCNAPLILKSNSERLENIIEDFSLAKTPKLSKNLDLNTFQNISANLKKNPPIEPDLKRVIEVYNLKVQFVELKFENGNINGRRVSIPKKALPFESPELVKILDAGMRIFEDVKENERKISEKYSSIQDDVKKLRETYLKPIKCRSDKSILIKENTKDYLERIKVIENKISNSKSELINDIDIEIENAKNRLFKELCQFFIKNPPKEIKEYYSKDRIPSKCSDYVRNLMAGMNFPDPYKMVEGMKLVNRFYDLTWNDLYDKELLKEFDEKGILKDDLDSIRQLRPAFEIRN
jgi:hypothetical protein